MATKFTEACPVYSPFFSCMGVATAVVFGCFGAAHGTAKSSLGIISTAIMRPERIFNLIIPVVMAGLIGIYGLVIAVLISLKVSQKMALSDGFLHFCSGLSVGLSGLVAGFCIGVIGDVGARALAQQPRLFVGNILILIFAEVLGLYGFIVAVAILTTKAPGLCE